MENITIFNGLSKTVIKKLKEKLEQKIYKEREIICNEGDFTSEFYLIRSGTVDIIKMEAKIAELKAGSSFGEMSLIDEEARDATVIAKEITRVFVLKKEDLEELHKEDVESYIIIMKNISRDLTDKLRVINARLRRMWNSYLEVLNESEV